MNKDKQKIANLKREISSLHSKIKFQNTIMKKKDDEIKDLKAQIIRQEKALKDAAEHILRE